MDSAIYYKSMLEKEIQNSKLFLILFTIFVVIGLALIFVLHGREHNIAHSHRPKRKRKLQLYQKEIKKSRIELAIFVSLIITAYIVGVFVCTKSIIDSSYDIKNDNYIYYKGEFDVVSVWSPVRKNHRKELFVVFYNQGNKISLYLEPEQYDSIEDHDATIVYSGASEILLDILPKNE